MGKIVHVVFWKVKRSSSPTGTSADEALAQLKKATEALKHLPEAEIMQLGPPLFDARAKGFDYGLYSVFPSPEALQKYAVSEAHLKVVAEILPHVDDAFAYDFELDA